MAQIPYTQTIYRGNELMSCKKQGVEHSKEYVITTSSNQPDRHLKKTCLEMRRSAEFDSIPRGLTYFQENENGED